MKCYVCGKEFDPRKGEGFGYGCCSKKCYLKRYEVVREKTVTDIWNKIENCTELKQLEALGFLRGAKQGKTMDVPLEKVFQSLKKQWHDLVWAYSNYTTVSKDTSELKRCIADLRNVAGCLFLKLLELERNG